MRRCHFVTHGLNPLRFAVRAALAYERRSLTQNPRSGIVDNKAVAA